MSKYEDQYDNNVMICPYCKESYQPDGEDYSTDERIEECESCGKKYLAWQDFTVSHESNPDCALNGEEHVWEKREVKDRGVREFCEICGKINPKEYE